MSRRVELEHAALRMLGSLGVETVAIGSTVMPTIAPEPVAELAGFGDTLRLGDVFTCDDSERVYRVVGIIQHDGAHVVWGRHVLETPIEASSSGPTSMLTHSPEWVQPAWRRTFNKLTQAQLDRWYDASTQAADGWHLLLRYGSYHYGEVEVRDGRPVQVRRRDTTGDIKLVAELAGRLTGWVPRLSGRYSDAAKLTRAVVSAQPLPRPQAQQKFDWSASDLVPRRGARS